ncbi:MAG: hypothetical protein RR063_10590 [Anaerovoracaceae bacterium]
MKTILEELYDSYNTFIPDTATQAEVDNAHQALIRSLEKPERKLVLRIIDNKDLIAGARASCFHFGQYEGNDLINGF